MFHGNRGGSGILSLVLEAINKSTAYEPAKAALIQDCPSLKPIHRRCIAVDEAKLSVKGKVFMYARGLP
jgi:hypothetical protein